MCELIDVVDNACIPELVLPASLSIRCIRPSYMHTAITCPQIGLLWASLHPFDISTEKFLCTAIMHRKEHALNRTHCCIAVRTGPYLIWQPGEPPSRWGGVASVECLLH